MSLTSQNDTVFVDNLKINSNITVNSGGTFSNGITGVYIIGGKTLTVVNGIVTSVV